MRILLRLPPPVGLFKSLQHNSQELNPGYYAASVFSLRTQFSIEQMILFPK